MAAVPNPKLMRTRFKGWYKPTEEELDQLWTTGVIALDANVLLAPYRVRTETQDLLFNVLEAYREQLWCPYQAGLEYQRNRLGVISQQVAEYDAIREKVAQAKRQLLARRREHPVIDADRFQDVVERSLASIERFVSSVEEGHPHVFGGGDLDDDAVRARWDELLDGKVGSPLSIDESWKRAADKRYDEKQPPGFEDRKKDKVARQQDWWRNYEGERLGPDPELCEEIGAAGGHPFWMYSVSRFIETGASRLDWEVSPDGPREFRSATEGRSTEEGGPNEAAPKDEGVEGAGDADLNDGNETRQD
jgi:hypothetical protein